MDVEEDPLQAFQKCVCFDKSLLEGQPKNTRRREDPNGLLRSCSFQPKSQTWWKRVMEGCMPGWVSITSQWTAAAGFAGNRNQGINNLVQPHMDLKWKTVSGKLSKAWGCSWCLQRGGLGKRFPKALQIKLEKNKKKISYYWNKNVFGRFCNFENWYVTYDLLKKSVLLNTVLRQVS